jgi:hypothetical protein
MPSLSLLSLLVGPGLSTSLSRLSRPALCWAGFFFHWGFIMSARILGFSGSRKLSQSTSTLASFVLATAVTQPSWSSFVVGCCPTGLDALVVNSPHVPASRLSVFRAVSRLPRHLVARSAQLADAVGALVAFPECACPSCVIPSATVARCFCGGGSGTWATAALAAGLGATVYVAGVAPGSLPTSWGEWVRSCRLPGCWRLVPHCVPQPCQLSVLSFV